MIKNRSFENNSQFFVETCFYEELKLKFANYKAVVVEDRVEKERQRRELEKQEAEIKATVHCDSSF